MNEALMTLHKLLPKFQKENNVEKVQCIVLTDGEANSMPYHVEVKDYFNFQNLIPSFKKLIVF